MATQHVPLLIVAQSGRFLAQSASQIRDRIWVADYFGDTDTQSISERWSLLPNLEAISQAKLIQHISTISNDSQCHLIFGGGIEFCPSVIEALPSNIEVYGNNTYSLNQLQIPANFFDLLDRLNLPHPETCFESLADKSGWLYKPSSGLGGVRIQRANDSHSNQNGYFQKLVTGISGSVLFLANGVQTKIIGINNQWLAPSPQNPFRLGGISSHFQVNKKHFHQIKQAINQITTETKLVGLNSLDFIISQQQQIKLLEINPRPSASCELYDTNLPIVQLHIDAVKGKLPEQPVKDTDIVKVLSYLFAPLTVTIKHNMHWNKQCHDLPDTDTTIREGQPICTLLTSGISNDDCQRQQKELKQDIFTQLYKNT